MKIEKYIEYLKSLNACNEAIEWSEQFSTAEDAWKNCAVLFGDKEEEHAASTLVFGLITIIVSLIYIGTKL